MNALPKLTEEERRRNLELATKARIERAKLRAQMKSGEVSPREALEDSRAQRMHVKKFLTSLPGIGQVRAEKIMAAFRIAPSRHVSGLGVRQRERIASLDNGWESVL